MRKQEIAYVEDDRQIFKYCLVLMDPQSPTVFEAYLLFQYVALEGGFRVDVPLWGVLADHDPAVVCVRPAAAQVLCVLPDHLRKVS